jgi:putative SOS response-associated peptidase YedK
MQQPFPFEQMRSYPVSKDVGKVQNQGADLIEEIA